MNKKQLKDIWCTKELVTIPFYYCVVVSQEQFDEQLKHLKVPSEDYMGSVGTRGRLHHFERKDGLTSYIIAVDTEVTLTDDVTAIGILVHEGVHLWQEYTRYIGEITPSDEFEAYSIQAIFLNLMQSFAYQKERLINKTT